MCCQEWPGLCRSSLGSEHLPCARHAGRWERVKSSTPVCVCVRALVCVSCQTQLICQRRGLFLERPELAAQNQAAINLQPH